MSEADWDAIRCTQNGSRACVRWFPFLFFCSTAFTTGEATIAWVRLSPEGFGPGHRADHCMAALDDKAFLMGGTADTAGSMMKNDLWRLDVKSSEAFWENVSDHISGDLPPSRMKHAMVAHSASSTLFVFGGQTASSALLGDLWSINVTSSSPTWKNLTDSIGRPEARHSTAITMVGSFLYLFGGVWQGDTYESEGNILYSYDVVDPMWKRLDAGGVVPSRRHSHGMVAIEDSLYVLGGKGGE